MATTEATNEAPPVDKPEAPADNNQPTGIDPTKYQQGAPRGDNGAAAQKSAEPEHVDFGTADPYAKGDQQAGGAGPKGQPGDGGTTTGQPGGAGDSKPGGAGDPKPGDTGNPKPGDTSDPKPGDAGDSKQQGAGDQGKGAESHDGNGSGNGNGNGSANGDGRAGDQKTGPGTGTGAESGPEGKPPPEQSPPPPGADKDKQNGGEGHHESGTGKGSAPEAHNTTTDANGVTWTYDKTGHAVHGTNAKTHQEYSYTYDQQGNITEQSVSKDGVTAKRDGSNVLKEVDYPDGSSVKFGYDSKLHLSQVERSDGTTYRFQEDPKTPGVGRWEQYQNDGYGHYTDTGKTADVKIGFVSLNGQESPITLTNRTIDAFQSATIGKYDGQDPQAKDWSHQREGLVNGLVGALDQKSPQYKELNDQQRKEIVEKLCQETSTLTPDQRKEVELEYQSKTGVSLRGQLESDHYVLARGYLERKDGQTGVEQPLVQDAVQQLKAGNENAATQLRYSLSQLNGKQMAEMERQIPPLSDQLKQLHDQGKLSDESYRTALEYIHNPTGSSGRDTPAFHKKLADIALADKGANAAADPERLQLLREALGPQTTDKGQQAAEKARQTLESSGALDKVKTDFGSHSQGEAADIIKFGQCTLATRIRQNDHINDNQKTVTDGVMQDMTEKDREMFGAGRHAVNQMSDKDREAFLNDPNAKPKVPDTDEKGLPLSPEQKQELAKDMEYYRQLHGAFVAAGGSFTPVFAGSKTAAVHKWEDLAEHGKPTLESQIADLYGNVANGSRQDFHNLVNHMSREDFDHLQHDPAYRAQIKRELGEMTDGASGMDRFAVEGLQHKIDETATAKDYETFVGAKVWDLPKNASAEQIERALRNCNQEEHKLLTTMPYMQEQLMKRINEVSDPLQKAALTHMAQELIHGDPNKSPHPPKFGASEDMLMAASDFKNHKIDANQLRQIFLKASDDPSSQAMLDKIKSGELDTKEAKDFDQALKASLGDTYTKDLLPAMRHSANTADVIAHNTKKDEVNLNGVVNDLKTLSVEERQKLLRLAESHDDAGLEKALPGLNPEQRDQVMKILANPQGADGDFNPVRPEDLVHMYMTDKKAKAEDMVKLFESLPLPQREEVAKRYAAKYGHDMLDDLGRRCEGDGARAELLRVALPDQNKFNDAMQLVDDIDKNLRSGALNNYFVRTWDGSGGRLDQLVHQLAVTEDPEQRKEIKEKLATAITDEKGTAAQVADTIVETAYVVAAIGTAPFEGAVAAGALALAGAGVRVGTHKAIEGKNYGEGGQSTMTEASKHMLSGAVGWGGSGLLSQAVEKLVVSEPVKLAMEQMIARVGKDRACEYLASSIESYIESTMPNADEATKTMIKTEVRKNLGEAMMKHLVHP